MAHRITRLGTAILASLVSAGPVAAADYVLIDEGTAGPWRLQSWKDEAGAFHHCTIQLVALPMVTTLARSNNGYALVVGSEEWELQVGADYDLTLKADGRPGLPLAAKAADKGSIAAPIATTDPVVEALRTASALALAGAEVEIPIPYASGAEGMGALDGCVAAQSAAAPRVAAAPPPEAAPAAPTRPAKPFGPTIRRPGPPGTGLPVAVLPPGPTAPAAPEGTAAATPVIPVPVFDDLDAFARAMRDVEPVTEARMDDSMPPLEFQVVHSDLMRTNWGKVDTGGLAPAAFATGFYEEIKKGCPTIKDTDIIAVRRTRTAGLFSGYLSCDYSGSEVGTGFTILSDGRQASVFVTLGVEAAADSTAGVQFGIGEKLVPADTAAGELVPSAVAGIGLPHAPAAASPETGSRLEAGLRQAAIKARTTCGTQEHFSWTLGDERMQDLIFHAVVAKISETWLLDFLGGEGFDFSNYAGPSIQEDFAPGEKIVVRTSKLEDEFVLSLCRGRG